MSLRIKLGSSSAAAAWLSDLFDPRLTTNTADLTSCILLESLDRPRILPICVEETSETTKLPRILPTLMRPNVLTPGILSTVQPPTTDAPTSIVAFHSFKGGVGRTLHAFAMASALAEVGVRTILIDADFEAPGITWMLTKRLPNPLISFADYLAIEHSDNTKQSDVATDLVAQRLQDSFINGIFVLPAFRSTAAFQKLDVRPEDILQGSSDPFVLTSMLYKLAAKVDAQVVIIDLRAGLSELSAGLLLGPRVQRVLVTNGSAQSLSGTEVVLNLIAKRAPSTSDDHPVPAVILNQIPIESRGDLSALNENLLRALTETVQRASDDELIRVALSGPSWFDTGLLPLPADWDDVASAVLRTSLAKTVEGIIQTLPYSKGRLAERSMREVDKDRKQLRDTAERFVVAETSQGNEFLPIAPLRRLVEDHKSLLPNAVVVGAKGAGKTYTYLQVLRRSGWNDFAAAARAKRPASDALLFPALQPSNLRSATWLRDKAIQTSQAIGLSSPLTQFELSDIIQSSLKDDLHQGEWRELWLDLVAWGLGFDPMISGAGRRLPEYLKSKDKRVLCLFDGLGRIDI